jgi:hypothetical protein
MTLNFFSAKKDTCQSVLEIPFTAIELTDEELALVDGGNSSNSNNVDLDNNGGYGGGHRHGRHRHGHYHHRRY